ASEIVSGTLQDYDRAVIIGQRSYGKGLVQQTRKLSYGSQLKVTIAKYYTPSGRCIQAINYAERDEDGSVAKIPDSLRTSFETAGGRLVYDGGGIDPDVKVEEEEMGNAIVNLYREMLIFDFATEYRRKHETIEGASSFALSDAEYDGFIKWLKSHDFNYTSKTEKAMDKLMSVADAEKHPELKAEIE